MNKDMAETIDWIRDPSLAPQGYRDSAVFVSAVTSIFERGPDTSKVRDLLTYLLLRRQPLTQEKIEKLDHDCLKPETTPERIEILRTATQREIELCLYPGDRPGKPYSVLQLIQIYTSSLRQEWASGEELTLLILALSCFSATTGTTDLATVYACLELYFKSRSVSVNPVVELEFIEDKLRYVAGVLNQVNRLFELDYSVQTRLRETAYIGAFASLVRASRMVESTHPIQEILRREVTQLKTLRLEQETSNV